MMRGRAKARDEVSMNLFPFLAVLICTMGSLIVLLVVMVQQARVKATVTEVMPPVAKQQEPDDVEQRLAAHQQQKQLAQDKQQEIEDMKWKSSMLQESYQATVKNLADQRLSLSHIEDHTRKLSEQAAKMQAEADMIAKMANQETENHQQVDEVVAQLENQIASARKELKVERERLANKPKSYSLVPYDGPNGTNRRPIYIECLRDRVVLQPENVVLFGEDFREPVSNNNPLAVALRAKREYLLEQGLLTGDEEPYPLLVVRPGAAAAYAAARSAMTAWEAEFGYELVEADLQLAYPTANQSLTRLLTDVVDQAREERRFMAAVRESQASSRGQREMLRPSANGGFESVGGGGGSGGGPGRSSGNPFGQGAAGNLANQPGSSPFGTGAGNSSRSGTAGSMRGGSSSSGGAGRVSGPVGQQIRFADGRGGGGVSGSDQGNAPGSQGERNTSGAHGSGQGSGRGRGTQPNSGAGNDPSNLRTAEQLSRYYGGSGTAPTPQGVASRFDDRSATGMGNGARGGPGNQDAGSGQANGQASAGGAGGGSGASASASGSGGQGSSGAGGSGAQSAQSRASSSNSAMQPFGQNASLAQSRGANWAMPELADQAVGIRRPLRILCDQQRLILVPEKGTQQQPQIFRHNGSVAGVVDPFVEAVRDRMRGWGIAGQGIFWQPTLQVEMQRGADSDYEQLLQLLDNSGIEVTREP